MQIGVCRHRALLFKYLCDHMVPPVPCELVRGYLHFSPHAWNIILIKRGATWVQMLIDACRPLDIREEKDPEYFCRIIWRSCQKLVKSMFLWSWLCYCQRCLMCFVRVALKAHNSS
ncbi:hypothetical protein GLYMA_03G105601v4 [Glycine max]|nr:hypothetical protein GLYMA_03G105601v4 [Glycine max]KAH1069382.1 hypothetical protein GYH30_006836 [Glycine max]